jgi:hypothetical protein
MNNTRTLNRTLDDCETVGDAVCLHEWVAGLPVSVLAAKPTRRPKGSSRGLSPAAHRGLLMWLYFALLERPRTLVEMAEMFGFTVQQAWGLILRCIVDGRIVRRGDRFEATGPLCE